MCLGRVVHTRRGGVAMPSMAEDALGLVLVQRPGGEVRLEAGRGRGESCGRVSAALGDSIVQ